MEYLDLVGRLQYTAIGMGRTMYVVIVKLISVRVLFRSSARESIAG